MQRHCGHLQVIALGEQHPIGLLDLSVDRDPLRPVMDHSNLLPAHILRGSRPQRCHLHRYDHTILWPHPRDIRSLIHPQSSPHPPTIFLDPCAMFATAPHHSWTPKNIGTSSSTLFLCVVTSSASCGLGLGLLVFYTWDLKGDPRGNREPPSTGCFTDGERRGDPRPLKRMGMDGWIGHCIQTKMCLNWNLQFFPDHPI